MFPNKCSLVPFSGMKGQLKSRFCVYIYLFKYWNDDLQFTHFFKIPATIADLDASPLSFNLVYQ